MTSLLLLMALSGSAAAHEPLRPMSECLDPDRARGWHLIDSDELLVDAGRKKYHLELTHSCPDLAFAMTVGFRSGDGIGRICGSAGDTVLMRKRSLVDIPCRIGKVTPLTKEQYQERLDDEQPKGKVEIREDESTAQR